MSKDDKTTTDATTEAAQEQSKDAPFIAGGDFLTITFEEPLFHGKQAIKQVTVRKPMAGDLRGLNLMDLLHQDVNSIRKIAPRITEPQIFEQDVDKMDPSDLLTLGSGVASFFSSKADRKEIHAELEKKATQL